MIYPFGGHHIQKFYRGTGMSNELNNILSQVKVLQLAVIVVLALLSSTISSAMNMMQDPRSPCGIDVIEAFKQAVIRKPIIAWARCSLLRFNSIMLAAWPTAIRKLLNRK
jgi:hypothetical protein